MEREITEADEWDQPGKQPVGVTVTKGHLGELTHDPNNARVHNPYNQGLIEDSLARVGAARSIVVDEDNVILAGNGTVDAAAALGMEGVIFVDVPGDALVAVRRTGLSDEQKVQLAIADNKATDTSKFDAGKVVELADAYDLGGIITENELDFMREQAERDLARMEEELATPLSFGANVSGFNDEDGGDGLPAGEFTPDIPRGNSDEEDSEPSSDEDAPTSDGSLLALANVTVDEPATVVKKGDIWTLGVHILLCCDVFADWKNWVGYLTDDNHLLVPYPGPLVVMSQKAETHRFVLLQPDPYIAGHLIDQYKARYGEAPVSKKEG